MSGINRFELGGDGEAALTELERAMAMIEVSLGPPTGWRLRQLVEAIEFYSYGQYELARAQTRRVQTPLAQIGPGEREIACALSIGAVRHEIRKLSDARATLFGAVRVLAA